VVYGPIHSTAMLQTLLWKSKALTGIESFRNDNYLGLKYLW